MTIAEEFMNYCIQVLEADFGQLSGNIVKGVRVKKNLTEKSEMIDFQKFIDMMEVNISVFSGKYKAAEICNKSRAKAIELMEKQKIIEIPMSADIEWEMNAFLAKNSLPTEGDVTDYAKYLALKYKGNSKTVEKGLIENIRNYVKMAISSKKINEEISNFLDRFPHPFEKDVSDFINYIRLEKLIFQEDYVKEAIEKERLYRKFHGEQLPEETATELDQFIDIIKTKDKRDISKTMKQHEISYLIKDDTPDDILPDFANLTLPDESDMKSTLEGMGLKHLIMKQ
ncbi:MAG: hypothetical protein J5U19_13020 [Candidatus Methanoperedens sp.]|nr:hypothetical protein [Candidatus Methanoperedens sp.]